MNVSQTNRDNNSAEPAHAEAFAMVRDSYRVLPRALRGAKYFLAVGIAAFVIGDPGRALLSRENIPPPAPSGDWRFSRVPEDGRDWWAFRPLASVEPPEVAAAAECNTPIDRFIVSAQASAGLVPNPVTDRRTLCRRVYFVLTGLPPTPDEIRAFLSDDSADAYAQLVDRLLASPRFGERWARHWLDVARFAESYGFEQDYDRPYAYHYRDFVIKAFNGDMPFDQFLQWQLAGDEMAPENPQAWMATGFLGAGAFPTQLTESEFESARYDELDDMAATTGVAFLGLTIGCARCHDHKFDPIPQGDYYRFASAFTTAIRSIQAFDLRTDKEKSESAAAEAAFNTAHAALVAEQKAHRDTATGKKLAELVAQHAKLRPNYKTNVMVVSEGVKPIPHHADDRGFPHFYPKTFYLTRGEVARKNGVAEPGFLQVLMRPSEEPTRWQLPPPAGSKTSRRRAALARWMTDTEYGAGHLAARVIVNRIWQHYFGRGIVATPNDFGRQGAAPTHPELLDWLAAELIRGGWRLKPIHKLIATSAVFMQSNASNAESAAIDPDNALLWHFRIRRLEGEAIRDSMLAASGLLDRKMFGPGTLDASVPRRSIYLFVKRSEPIPSMQLFDAPEPLASQGRRASTTTGPGALWFMNNVNVRHCAEALAEQIDLAAEGDRRRAITHAYWRALGRAPSDEELAGARAFVDEQFASYSRHIAAGELEGDARRIALADLAQVLFGLNEFVYLE